MSAPAEELLEGIRELLKTFTVDEDRFPPAEGRIKYNALDFQALYFFHERPGSLTSALAKSLGISATTAKSVCDRLVRRGFVERSKHPTDQRAVSLYLTRKGLDIAQSIRRQDVSNCELMLSKLPAGERGRFANQVKTIASALSTADEH